MATILIIDDSPTELHLFQSMLEKSGFETLVADSGEDGIRQAEASRPDCILMDVVMPGMNGGPGDRQDLGHAAGRRRIHRETDRPKGVGRENQLGDGRVDGQDPATGGARRAAI
jgi:hypothetical protein